MFSVVKRGKSYLKPQRKIYCTSDDIDDGFPEGQPDSTVLIVKDTNKKYIYDSSDDEWYEVTK